MFNTVVSDRGDSGFHSAVAEGRPYLQSSGVSLSMAVVKLHWRPWKPTRCLIVSERHKNDHIHCQVLYAVCFFCTQHSFPPHLHPMALLFILNTAFKNGINIILIIWFSGGVLSLWSWKERWNCRVSESIASVQKLSIWCKCVPLIYNVFFLSAGQ